MNFFVEYWVEFVFGLVGACIIWAIKKYYKLKDIEREKTKKDFQDNIIGIVDQHLGDEITRSVNKDTELAIAIDEVRTNNEALKQGLLSVQGKQYREYCELLLENKHNITVEEFEQEEDDYHAYKALKGNHRGDALHNAVVAKFHASHN